MSYKFIPLSDIPHKARALESKMRRAHRSEKDALTAAQFRIEKAPKKSTRKIHTLGWVLSLHAARVLCKRTTLVCARLALTQ